MKKLHFNSTQEFESLFRSKTLSVTNAIVSGIEKGMMSGKKTALLFEITFEQADIAYEISLPQSQWQVALENCLKYYHDNDMINEQIDTWKLIEAVKSW